MPLTKYLWSLMAAALFVPSVLIAADQFPHRISMAISGGASKGAYEAGLNWGVLKFMYDIDELTPVTGGQFRAIELSSFTGASAGGINTLLSSLTWCAIDQDDGGPKDTISSNLFYDLWTIPDVNRLLPPQVDSIYYLADDALLSRHDLLNASEMLRKRWNEPVHRPGCRVPLGVTVTKVVPEMLDVSRIQVPNQRFYIVFEARTKSDGTLGFFWNVEDYAGLKDPAMLVMPSKSRSGEIDDQFIEDAILASSAYPGGFGRRNLQYCRLKLYDVEEANGENKHQASQDKKQLYCPEGFELAEAEFSDGGLFDNLPIGLARKLAEDKQEARDNPTPVTYVFMDPNRMRYESPEPEGNTACDSENPPEACRRMDFSIITEHRPVFDALGTARKFELYRELTGQQWLYNLSDISEELATRLSLEKPELSCTNELPLFNTTLGCSEALRRSSDLLELTYFNTHTAIHSPFSLERLQSRSIVKDCKRPDTADTGEAQAVCGVNLWRYRNFLAESLLRIADKSGLEMDDIRARVKGAKITLHNDRLLRITDRGAPITGTLLSDFGAFLDLKFRQYDYYVGVYDAVVSVAYSQCQLQYSRERQARDYQQCFDAFAGQVYGQLGVDENPGAQYVFASLAKQEFGEIGALKFAYEPMPEEFRDMRIIFDALNTALEAGEVSELAQKGAFFTEDSFFFQLKAEGFQPSPTEDGSKSLLQEIMEDPDEWPAELTRRMTSRAVYLEAQARDIFAEREPDPEKRESSYTELLGATAYVAQVATYNYPDFTFSPSTASEDWAWRNVIPYEIGVDIIEGDISFTWQPTWSVSKYNLVGVRGTLGFAGGILRNAQTEDRENYGSLGLDFTRRTNSSWISSWGVTPTAYHSWKQPETYDQTTLGGDVHINLFKDRVRVGAGMRDYRNASDTWLFTIGVTDIPGMTYWLTR